MIALQHLHPTDLVITSDFKGFFNQFESSLETSISKGQWLVFPTGKQVILRPLVLTFGPTNSPMLTTRMGDDLIDVTETFVPTITADLYVDDGLWRIASISDDPSLIRRKLWLLSTILAATGLQLRSDTMAWPTQLVKWIGYIFDIAHNRVWIPRDKFTALHDAITLVVISPTTTTATLEQIAGLWNFIRDSSHLGRVALRALYDQLGLMSASLGSSQYRADRIIRLPTRTRHLLTLWLLSPISLHRSLRDFQPLNKSSLGIQPFCITTGRVSILPPSHTIITSDASIATSAASIHHIINNMSTDDISFIMTLLPSESLLSSFMAEILGLEAALITWASSFNSTFPSTILLVCDNKNVILAIAVATSKANGHSRPLHFITDLLLRYELHWNISVFAQWRPRSHPDIITVDQIPKKAKTSFTISPTGFSIIAAICHLPLSIIHHNITTISPWPANDQITHALQSHPHIIILPLRYPLLPPWTRLGLIPYSRICPSILAQRLLAAIWVNRSSSM